nr:TldD/PmbA family protein [Candidatus Freyrarchaeum guaymaensis]
MSDLAALVEWMVDYAERHGAHEAEVYFSYSRELEVEISLGQLSSCHLSDEYGVGLRVIVDGAVGFSFSNSLERRMLEVSVDRAVKAAKASKPDKRWTGLPDPRKPTFVSGVFDRRIRNISEEELVTIARTMLDAAEDYSHKVTAYWGVAAAGYGEVFIANSRGLNVHGEGTSIGCALGTVAKEGSLISPECSDFDFKRTYEVNPEKVGETASQLAVNSLKRIEVSSGVYPVVLAYPALHALIEYTFLQAITGDNVLRGKSPYAGRIGEQVSSSMISIVDDGRLEGGLNSSPFDGEGAPSQKTTIIKKGTLKSFLYDTYWSRVAGAASTGNAIRSSYASTPKVGPSNLIIEKGSSSFEDLIGEISNGLLVWDVQGAHSSNPESGEVSVVATPCWLIRNGNITSPVKGLMLADNFYGMLKRVNGVGDDVKSYSFLVSPSIRFSSVKAVSKSSG